MKKLIPIVLFLAAVVATTFGQFILAAVLFILSIGVCIYNINVKEPLWLNVTVGVLNGICLFFMGVVGFLAYLFKDVGSFGAWGRPLRIRKKLSHAELIDGEQWARGPKPDCGALDFTTREALSRLWYYDAQKEHASVPAFARLTWILVGLGASPKLIEKLHYCGLQEIEHARRTLALANAYGDTPKTFAALPAMLGEKMGCASHAWSELALETLADGCLIEDFNADIADQACRLAEDPAAVHMVKIIAREERFHGAVAWEILEFCLEKGGSEVKAALQKALRRLPTQLSSPYSKETDLLIAQADPNALKRHGRVPRTALPEIFQARLAKTRARVESLIAGHQPDRLDAALPSLNS